MSEHTIRGSTAGPSRTARLQLKALLLTGAALCSASAQARGAELDRTVTFDIESQALEKALVTFSQQANIQVVLNVGSVGSAEAPALKAAVPARVGLQELLRGTGYQFAAVGERTVSVMRENSDELRLADADTAAGASSDQSAPGDVRSRDVNEVVVTAQKREERLHDVPVSVSVLDATSLTDANQVGMRDYYTKIPGLNITPWFGSWTLAIRGIAPGQMFDNPTVATLIDDVPYGTSTAVSGGSFAPDFDPNDLARIEVLRGPQGTLYGASSLGGLLKFVTTDPSTERMSSRVQLGLNGVRNADELGYSVRASVNVPLSDTLALRASAYTRDDPGYIDDPLHGRDAVNSASSSGGRLAMLWKPSEDFSLKLSAMLQDRTTHGSNTIASRDGSLLQPYALVGVDAGRSKDWSFGATAHVRLGAADLTAITGYSRVNVGGAINIPTAAGLAAIYGADSVYVSYDLNPITKLSQEVRVNVPLGERIDWLAGAFYTREKSDSLQRTFAVDSFAGEVAGPLFATVNLMTYDEYALFTDLTYRVTDRFDIQVGGRQSRNDQAYTNVATNSLSAPPTVTAAPEIDSSADAFTFLVTPRFKITEELMLYGRAASGYRVGGSNGVFGVICGLPDYRPDKTLNYEVGVKGTTAERRLSFDASVYYIDWKDAQITGSCQDGLYGFKGNGSQAKSQGVELTVDMRPADGMNINVWGSWNEAELTEDLAAGTIAAGIFGLKGDRLPLSARFSGGLSLDHEFPLGAAMSGFAGGSLSYTGVRYGSMVAQGVERERFPAYTKTDLRAGLRYGRWTGSLYINNVADRRGIISADTPVSLIYIIQPRTIGLNVAADF
jgi:iron complex outermembrane receptor protein